MRIDRFLVLVACLLLAVAARAEDASRSPPAMDDLVYKGLVGKALDAVPMDAEERAALQRTSAVVSGTLGGRSVSVWAGLTNPILLVVGLAWGLFSASNIKAAEAGAKPVSWRRPTPGCVDPRAASGRGNESGAVIATVTPP